MNDKKSFIPLLEEHARIFGNGLLSTVAADKGYWKEKNRKCLKAMGIPSIGLQRPASVNQEKQDTLLQERLQNRRAGIEPLIGHAKHGGQLGKGRMKSDTATLAAGYGSVLAFNLRQMIRWQQGKMENIKAAA
jgi:transposase, IS5 family